MKMIGILNIGINNIGSIKNAIETLGYDTKVLISNNDILNCDSIILPGVGSFNHGMSLLKEKEFISPLQQFIEAKKPILGICLGMQLLFDVGFEGGKMPGLGFVQGKVDKIVNNNDLKLPHIGWNEVSKHSEHFIWRDIKDNKDFYFVHSYRVNCKNHFVLGETIYGEVFPSIIAKNSIIGMQFHPEKSQKNGLKFLQNFLSWDGKC